MNIPSTQNSPLVDDYIDINGTFNLLVFLYNAIEPNGGSNPIHLSYKFAIVTEKQNWSIYARPEASKLIMEFSDDDFATVKSEYTFTREWSVAAASVSNGFQVTRPMEGSTLTCYGILDADGWRSTLYPWIIPFTNKDYKIRIKFSSSAGSFQRIYSAYAPFKFTITPPDVFYNNRINRFTATIGSRFVSKLEYYPGGASAIGAYQSIPVRNPTIPYITSGQQTNYIYLFPARNAAQTYQLVAYLYVQNAQYPNQLTMVAFTNITGDGVLSDAPYRDGLTTTVTFDDPSGIYDRYGVLLRNTDCRIRTRINVVPSYGLGYVVRKEGAGSSEYLYYGQDTFAYEITELIPDFPTLTMLVAVGNVDISIQETFTATVLAYFRPTFPSLDIHRCDENGIANDNGDHCRIEWSVSIMPINDHNSKALTIQHPSGTTTYDPLDLYRQSGILIVAASTESSYSIVFTATDDFMSEKRTLILSSAGVIMDWLYNGRGVSFGKVAMSKFAVEISEMWRLLCYKLILSGVDVEKWMGEVIARLDGIEQFNGNLGVTDQHQVTFYNDSTILDRQWIRTGQSAYNPNIETPERDSTKQYAYSFVGWALTNGATAEDPTALDNITSYRNIYAAFERVLRNYRVEFYNGEDLVETAENIDYGSPVTRTSSNPSGDGTFFAYIPQPTFIEQNTKTYARYYKRSTILDTWDTVIEKCNNKTAGNEYFVGQYKPIGLSNGVTVNARLMGIREDEISGQNKAETTWMFETVVGDGVAPSWNEVGNISPIYQSISNPNMFTVLNQSGSYAASIRSPENTHKSTGKLTFKQTASELWSLYYDSGGIGRKIKVFQDGTLIFESDGTQRAYGTVSVTKTAGDESTITFETEMLEGYYKTQYRPYFYLNTGTIAYMYNAAAEAGVGSVYYIKQYENGKGAVGGYEYSNIRKAVEELGMELLPTKIRENLKAVKKTSPAWISEVLDTRTLRDATIKKGNCVTIDKLWIPSRKELFGADSGELTECAEYGYAGSGVPCSSSESKWLRDVGSNYEYACSYRFSGASNISRNILVSNGYRFTICFCL